MRQGVLRTTLVALLAAGVGAAAAVAHDAPGLLRMTTSAGDGLARQSAPAIDFAIQQQPATAAERALARRAERLVDVKASQVGFKLDIRGPVPGLGGQTVRADRTITLFVNPLQTPHLIAHDLAHEIAHAVDDTRLTPALRGMYLRARNAGGRPWFPSSSASDYDSGAGDFAEVFALCHAASPEFRSQLAPEPANACALLPALARTTTLSVSRRQG